MKSKGTNMELKRAIKQFKTVINTKEYKDFLNGIIETYELRKSLKQTILNIPVKVVHITPNMCITNGVVKSLTEFPSPIVLERLRTQKFNVNDFIERKLTANIKVDGVTTIYKIPLILNGELRETARAHYGKNVFYILPPELEIELIEGSRTKVDSRLESIKEKLDKVDRYDLKSIEGIIELLIGYVENLKIT